MCAHTTNYHRIDCMFYCTGKHIEKWLRHRSRNSVVWKCLKAKIKVKINQTLNKRMKTKVQRKMGPAKNDDLSWLRDFDSFTR